MREYKQFINWIPKVKESGKTDKIPVDADRKVIDPLSPTNHLTYDDAVGRAKAMGLGLGFVFTENDPYFFVDIDDALTRGGWSPVAQQIMAAFPGCLIEISMSKKGLHIFGRGSYPGHKCRAAEYGLELYTSKRFVALTGSGQIGNIETDGQAGLNWLVDSYFAATADVELGGWTDTPVAEWSGPDDDEDLLKIAVRANPFSNKVRFIDLYQGNADKLSAQYPSGTVREPFDHSAADAALASHLAFFTGKNCERIERIMSKSALGQRDKWVSRDDYRKRTILGAVAVSDKVYYRPDPVGKSAPADARVGTQFLDLHGQLEHFKGCVYVIGMHRVFVPQMVRLLKPEQFRSTFGGYQFALTFDGKPTKNAFEAFTESQLYNFPKAWGTCFRPEEDPGGVITNEGVALVNTYYPVRVDRLIGDPSRFIHFLNKILPDERDRTILMSYIAACVQFPGRKFQWAPMLQGVQGNGKSFLIRVVSKAVGEKYFHSPNASDLSGNGLKFTGWMHEKLFIGIEEFYMSGSTEIQEGLKDKITNSRIEMQYKGADQFMADNRANFFLCSNFKDAVKKTKGDRRFCILYCAQQSVEDLRSSGMSGSYFPALYDWAEEEGYAIIAEYLHTYKIPDEFNPATYCHRAPSTTSTQESIELSLGSLEQEILEAVEEGRVGFRGGWISSIALDNLLLERRRKCARNKRQELLFDLGYSRKCRMNMLSSLDGGKRPILYITNRGSLSMRLYSLDNGTEASQAYTEAQISDAHVSVSG